MHRSHQDICISGWQQGRDPGTLPGAVPVGHSPAVSEDSEERTGREVELPRRLGWRGGVATGNRKPGAGRHGGGMEILWGERGRSLWR